MWIRPWKRPAPFIVAAVLACSAAWNVRAQDTKNQTKLVLDGSTTVGPMAKALAEYFMSANKGINITVSESGSGNGVKSLINGTCDVADMSRFMKDSEFKAAVEKNVLPVAHVIALDGIAIIVHPSNPVADLSIEQIRDIYAGKLARWKEVGGPDVKIVKISRDSNSGTYETFEQMVMKETRIAADAEYVGSNGAIRQRVQITPGAIGYVGLGFADRTVKALSINKIKPDRTTVASGHYPIARPLFMFTNGFPALGTPLHAFVTLYLTPKGQEIIESLGFVPVTSYPTPRAKDE